MADQEKKSVKREKQISNKDKSKLKDVKKIASKTDDKRKTASKKRVEDSKKLESAEVKNKKLDGSSLKKKKNHQNVVERESKKEIKKEEVADEKMKIISSENQNKMDFFVHASSSSVLNQAKNVKSRRKSAIGLKHKKKNKSIPVFRTSDVALLVLITCVISLLLGGLVSYRFIDKKTTASSEDVVDTELQSFIQNYNYIVDNYYTDINKKEMLDAAFKAMVESLGDAYSGFIDESESNNFDITLRGSYTGIGVEVINDNDGNIVIYSIFENSPAGRSDLQVGDILVRVNGQDVLATETTDFTKIIQNSSTQQFTMVVRRGAEEKTITIKKEFITLQSVVSKTFEYNGKKIGYLDVSIFAANTGSQFHTALTNLENKNIDGLVIDLRDNGGGHLFVVENMISEFLDSSHIIYQDESKNGKNTVYSSGSVTKTYPISILVNGVSASASEVMTAALMEEYGAKVVGTTTYGKGTVQELHESSSGEEYKFTIKKWLTPKGNWIHSKGIVPDYEVVLNGDYYKNPSDDTDNQLQKAISVLFES